MKNLFNPTLSCGVRSLCCMLICSLQANAAIQVMTELDQSPGQAEEPSFYLFNNIPVNTASDLANGILPLIVGSVPAASGGAVKLTDGVGAVLPDDPANNFFWNDNSPLPLVISFDLGSIKAIGRVNSYSWHHGNGVRAAQDYNLYGSTGTAIGFNPANLASPGWTLLTHVDSEVPGGQGANAGQQGVSVSDTTGLLGNFRYVGFGVNAPFGFGNTFYSEIDIVAIPEPSALALFGIGIVCSRLLRKKAGA